MQSRHRRRRIGLGPERWLLIAPQTAFTTGIEQTTDHCYLHCLLGHPHDGLGPLLLERAVDRDSRTLLEAVFVQDGQRGVAAWHLPPCMALIGAALADLPARAWPRLAQDERIEQVCRMLERDLAGTSRNSALAAAVGMSTTAFNRRFRHITGRSPQEHLLGLRMDHARIQLEHSDAGIETIAEACGFATRSHFSATFARVVGVPPATYRRQVRA
ncbi:MAG: helix-turn-helix domain-containing protein [Planctomycetota bacterium]